MMRAASLVFAVTLGGCAGLPPEQFSWVGAGNAQRQAGPSPVRVRWAKSLVQAFGGPYVPVERASAALDPAGNRIYIGSSAGSLYALSGGGGRIYHYDAGAPIDAAPALDADKDELYLAGGDGVVHALDASTGNLRWRVTLPGPIRRPPVLTAEAVLVASETNLVTSLSRNDGAVLWDYKREFDQDFAVAGHAGVALEGERVLTGFSDGAVLALDVQDGNVLWQRETVLDTPSVSDEFGSFLDVDATPVVVDGVVWAASYTTGLYGLEPSNGTVLWRESELTGITNVAVGQQTVLVASSDSGISALAKGDRRVIWRRSVDRGVPSEPRVAGGFVYVGESDGGFLILSVEAGREVGRVELGRGFSGAPALARNQGYVLSNGGTLVAFSSGAYGGPSASSIPYLASR